MARMRIFWILLNFLILVMDLSMTEWVEYKSPFSVVLITPSENINQIMWGKCTNNTFAQIYGIYTKVNDDISGGIDGHIGFKSNITTEDGTYKSVFTIESVTLEQHKTFWGNKLMFSNSSNKETCYALKVFVPPKSPICSNVTLLNIINIEINCSTINVFPQLLCEFFVATNSTKPDRPIYGLIKYERETSFSNYSKCTYTGSAEILGPGSHVFYVVMHANIASNITENMKKSSQKTLPIIIGYPKAALATDCQMNKYIIENKTVTCTCYDNNTSFLPTQIRWSDNVSKNGTLNFTARRPYLNDPQKMLCFAKNSLDWTDEINYEPIVAYPPDVNLTILETTIDWCEYKNASLIGNCFINNGYPKASSCIKITGSSSYFEPFINSSEIRFNSALFVPGIINISCHAYNDEFSLNISNFFSIEGPPETPKIFKISNDVHMFPTKNILQVFNGEMILCQSLGGYPYPKNISLYCGNNIAETFDQDNVNLTLNISSLTTSKSVSCTCIVAHKSKCQQNKTTIQLKFSVPEIVAESIMDFQTIYIGTGIAFGVIILTILTLASLKISIYQKIKMSSENFEKLVDNSHLYFIQHVFFSVSGNRTVGNFLAIKQGRRNGRGKTDAVK